MDKRNQQSEVLNLIHEFLVDKKRTVATFEYFLPTGKIMEASFAKIPRDGYVNIYCSNGPKGDARWSALQPAGVFVGGRVYDFCTGFNVPLCPDLNLRDFFGHKFVDVSKRLTEGVSDLLGKMAETRYEVVLSKNDKIREERACIEDVNRAILENSKPVFHYPYLHEISSPQELISYLAENWSFVSRYAEKLASTNVMHQFCAAYYRYLCANRNLAQRIVYLTDEETAAQKVYAFMTKKRECGAVSVKMQAKANPNSLNPFYQNEYSVNGKLLEFTVNVLLCLKQMTLTSGIPMQSVSDLFLDKEYLAREIFDAIRYADVFLPDS